MWRAKILYHHSLVSWELSILGLWSWCNFCWDCFEETKLSMSGFNKVNRVWIFRYKNSSLEVGPVVANKDGQSLTTRLSQFLLSYRSSLHATSLHSSFEHLYKPFSQSIWQRMARCCTNMFNTIGLHEVCKLIRGELGSIMGRAWIWATFKTLTSSGSLKVGPSLVKKALTMHMSLCWLEHYL